VNVAFGRLEFARHARDLFVVVVVISCDLFLFHHRIGLVANLAQHLAEKRD